jgi:predicted RNA-binding Zn-ribbon protein involved in translation (DUF1610 family)
MDLLLQTLKKDYPQLVFTPGAVFSWSAPQQKVTYTRRMRGAPNEWSLLHELGHALLGHTAYQTDVELLQMEVAAWERAVLLAKDYKLRIDPDHIQDCLDTYRDWLHRRSTCPACGTISLQTDATTYACHNCQTTWHVTRSRLCRPYRRTIKKAPAN